MVNGKWSVGSDHPTVIPEAFKYFSIILWIVLIDNDFLTLPKMFYIIISYYYYNLNVNTVINYSKMSRLNKTHLIKKSYPEITICTGNYISFKF